MCVASLVEAVVVPSDLLAFSSYGIGQIGPQLRLPLAENGPFLRTGNDFEVLVNEWLVHRPTVITGLVYKPNRLGSAVPAVIAHPIDLAYLSALLSRVRPELANSDNREWPQNIVFHGSLFRHNARV